MNHDNAYLLSDKVLYESNVFITPGGIFGNAGDAYVRIKSMRNHRKDTGSNQRN